MALNLNTILGDSFWGTEAAHLNQNFLLIKTALDELDNSVISGGGRIRSVYKNSDFGGKFVADSTQDTFNSYAINQLHIRINTLETKTYSYSLSALTDTNVSGQTSGQVLSWNGSKWTNKNANELVSGFISYSLIGVNNGIVPLGSDGKIASTYLPSYVDDVLESAGKANFPSTGESGKIYIDTTTNIQYRWSGTQYVGISSSIALGETDSTAYPGNKGKANADAITTLKAISILAGNGLTGGGNLTANTTLSLLTATSSTLGGVKVGNTLAIDSGVLNLKSGIVTAGTYFKTTVDTYGRVTAGSNPTTLAGYGITDGITASSAASTYVKKTGDSMSGALDFTGSASLSPILLGTNKYISYDGTTGSSLLSWDGSTSILGSINGSTTIRSNAVDLIHSYNGTGYAILDARNYNSYAPTKTGTGASGTWGISTTGNAGTATRLQTARTLWGQSFDGTGNVSGDLNSVGKVTFTKGHIIQNTGTGFDFYAASGQGIYLYPNMSNNIATCLNVQSNGYVGIGASPSYKLHVNGTFYSSGGATFCSNLVLYGSLLVKNVTTSSTSASLEPNRLYKLGTISSLTVAFLNRDSDSYQEYMFEFTAGSSSWNITMPSDVKWASDHTIISGKKYQVSILNNIALMVGA